MNFYEAYLNYMLEVLEVHAIDVLRSVPIRLMHYIIYLSHLKALRQISKKRCFKKCCSCNDTSFSFIDHILTELFEKTEN